MPWRCVKCKDPHDPKICPLNISPATGINVETMEDDMIRPLPAYVNCGQTGHPASYRKCPMYKSLIKRRKEMQNDKKQQQEKEDNMKKQLHQAKPVFFEYS